MTIRRLLLAAVAAAGISFAASAAQADIINFDALPDGHAADPLVLPGATFTAVEGFNYIASGGLCASITAADPANCSKLLQVDFDAPSSAISFTFFGNNQRTVGADIGDVLVFHGGSLLGLVNLLVVDDSGGTRDLVSLGGFSDVTRLVISSTDFGGLLYDDFAFTSEAGVPEPMSWALMILGFGVAGGMLRRRSSGLRAV